MSAAPVEVRPLLDMDFHSEPRLISSLDMDFRAARGAGPRGRIESIYKSRKTAHERSADLFHFRRATGLVYGNRAPRSVQKRPKTRFHIIAGAQHRPKVDPCHEEFNLAPVA